jgi:hypothetical protein
MQVNPWKIVLQVLIGLVFILSAISKLLVIEHLEFTLVENIRLSFFQAMIASRMLIALELFLGLHLCVFHDHRWNKKVSLIALIVFTIYLVILYIRKGNEENCGCFGDALILSTSKGIIKNLVLLVLNILLFIGPRQVSASNILERWFQLVLLGTSIGIVLIREPLNLSDSEPDAGITLNWNLVYQRTENPGPSKDLREGKHIVAFMSSSCMYCKRAAYKLAIMHRKYPSTSAWFFINGSEDHIAEFLKETRSEDIPHSQFNGPDDFRALAGNTLPAIYFIENGKVIHKRYFDEIREADFETWK